MPFSFFASFFNGDQLLMEKNMLWVKFFPLRVDCFKGYIIQRSKALIPLVKVVSGGKKMELPHVKRCHVACTEMKK